MDVQLKYQAPASAGGGGGGGSSGIVRHSYIIDSLDMLVGISHSTNMQTVSVTVSTLDLIASVEVKEKGYNALIESVDQVADSVVIIMFLLSDYRWRWWWYRRRRWRG